MTWRGPTAVLSAVAFLLLAVTPTALTTATAAATSPPTALGSASQPPDVIVIMTDDQRGGTEQAMPYTSSYFGSQGVRYDRAVVPTNLCCPARAAFLTGRYAHDTDVWENSGKFGGYRAFKQWQRQALPVELQQAGYQTALFGKYINHFNDGGGRGSKPPGWDVFHTYDDPKLSGGYWTRVTGLPSGYTTDVLGTGVVNHIAEADPDKPLFVMYSPFAPHANYDSGPYRSAADDNLLARFRAAGAYGNPSMREKDVSDKPRWLRRLPRTRERVLRATADNQSRSLMGVDANVRRIIQTQAATRGLDNTMIIYLSDNGYSWGDHRLRLKRHPYFLASRIPLWIKYPAGVVAGGGPGTVTSRLANQLDVTATIAQLAGTGPVGEGKSLLGSVRATLPLEASRSRGGMVNRPGFCGVRTKRYLYLHYTDGTIELYDYRRDPYELENVFGDLRYQWTPLRLELKLDPGCDLTQIAQMPGTDGGE